MEFAHTGARILEPQILPLTSFYAELRVRGAIFPPRSQLLNPTWEEKANVAEA